MAFANSSVCLVHGKSRPIGALFHLPHGLSNAVLLPTVTRNSVANSASRYATVARLLGCCASDTPDDEAGSPQNNPRVPSSDEIVALYQEAW